MRNESEPGRTARPRRAAAGPLLAVGHDAVLQGASFVAEPVWSGWRVTAALADGRRYSIAGFTSRHAAHEWIRQGASNWLKSRFRKELRAVRYRITPKYRSPDGKTWAGRGRCPKWLAGALQEGKTLEDFLIAGGGGWTSPDGLR